MDNTHARLVAAEEELEQLRQQVTTITAERDCYKKLYLGELARSSTEFSQEELDSAIPTGPWFEEFLKRLENGDPDAMNSWPQKPPVDIPE